VDGGVVEIEPPHHQPASEQRHHVQIEVQGLGAQRGAAREPARLADPQVPGREPHRGIEPQRDVVEPHLAIQRARQLRLEQRAGPGRREHEGQRDPRGEHQRHEAREHEHWGARKTRGTRRGNIHGPEAMSQWMMQKHKFVTAARRNHVAGAAFFP
jgi:hypothetical protein